MGLQAWRHGAILLIGLGLLVQSPWLFALGTLVGITGAASSLWARASLKGVTYRRRLSRRRAFPGEPVALELEVFNGKLLPVARLEVADAVDRRLEIEGEELLSGVRAERRAFYHSTALLPYERITYTYAVHGPRGIHSLGPASMRAGDLFGIYESTGEESTSTTLIVYPEPRRLPSGALAAAVPQMERPRARALLRDPARPLGVRELRPEDERRMVNWKASARLGRLMVKIPEPMGKPTLIVIVNAATFAQQHIGVDRELQERVISAAAGIVRDGVDRGLAVGLAVNSGARGHGRSIRVPPRVGRRYLRLLYEALAAVSPFITVSLENQLILESRDAPPGASLVVVTGLVTPDLIAGVARVARSGRDVTLVRLDSNGATVPLGLREIRLDTTQ